jgi:hypothetical protein
MAAHLDREKHYLIQFRERGLGASGVQNKLVLQHPLRQLLRKLPQTYICHGDSNVLARIPMILNDGSTLCGTLSNPSLEKLLKGSLKSSFGRGLETVFDEQVRKENEVTAVQLTFGKTERHISNYSGYTGTMKHPAVEEILQLFKEEISLFKCIGIPLYHLYTSLSIFPEYLKKIDSELFSVFLKEGYSLILTPIEVATNRNNVEETGDLDDESIWIRWLDFPKTVFQWNEKTQQINTKTMVTWPKSLKMTFVMNGMETGTLVYDVNQENGNEGPPPENHYLSGALVIMKTPIA